MDSSGVWCGHFTFSWDGDTNLEKLRLSDALRTRITQEVIPET